MVLATLFRSADVPADGRADVWQEVTSRSVMPIAFNWRDPRDLTGVLRGADLGGVQLTLMRHSPLEAARTPVLVRRSDPEIFVLAMTLSGSMTFAHAERSATVTAGDLMVFDSALPFGGTAGSHDGVTEALNVQVPKSLMPVPPAAIKHLVGNRLPVREGIGAVTAATLAVLRAQIASCTPGDATRLGSVVTDLFAALLTHHLDADGLLPADARHTALLLTVESFIRKHLANPGLSVDMIAAAHHISVRNLYRLFEHREVSVAAHIRRLRLERCRRDLADPDFGRLPVRDIATRWGFTHPAHFSRAFRTTYGVSPRAYRSALAGGHAGTAPPSTPGSTRCPHP